MVLNDLSKYLGYSDFNEFNSKNPINPQNTKIKVTTDGKETTKESRSFSDIIINITNAPVFTLPEFITKHSNSFGLVGILLVSGFLFKNKEDFFGLEKDISFDSFIKDSILSAVKIMPPICKISKNSTH